MECNVMLLLLFFFLLLRQTLSLQTAVLKHLRIITFFLCSPSLIVCVAQEGLSGQVSAQPPTVARKNGSPVGICARCAHVFCTCGRRLACSVGARAQKISESEPGREIYRGRVVGWVLTDLGWLLAAPAEAGGVRGGGGGGAGQQEEEEEDDQPGCVTED